MYFLLYNTENARARPDVTKGHEIKAVVEFTTYYKHNCCL